MKSQALRGGLAGALVSVALWAADLASIRTLSFAGATDPEAQQRIIENTRLAVLALEGRLLAFHCAIGFVLGLACHLAFGLIAARRGRALRRPHLATMAVVLTWHVLSLLAMVATYPQLFADRWWLGGGALAWLQRIATHVIGARVLDVLLAGLTAALAGLAAAAGIATLARTRRAGWRLRSATRAGAAAVLCLAAWAATRGTHARSGGGPPNLLIVASDSMRTDRLESAEVMPFTAGMVPQGTLFRHAFTPVARTFPSWVSTLTGSEPRRHGVRTMFPSVDALAGIGPTFVTTLRDRGYHTFVVSDFAGDIFPRFAGGFEAVDTPTLTIDHLARATVLSAHSWSLPLLRIAPFRKALPEWRNLASLSDPEWLVDAALDRIADASGRPFAGVLFFSTAHFPFVAPAPDYRLRAGGYRGRYLYHAPPTEAGAELGEADVAQIRARYDGALRSIDRATARLHEALQERGLLDGTVLVFTSDHGEALYETPGLFGHGDTLDEFEAQAVPILLVGPGVPRGAASDAQVRLMDLGATVLDLMGASPDRTFGDGVSLLQAGVDRPVCVETDIWFWPTLPIGLRGKRLEYEGISELLELDPRTRQLVLRADRETIVETAKERGIVAGNRLHRVRLTPNGVLRETIAIPGVAAGPAGTDPARLFDERCVAGDPALSWLFDAVAFERPAAGGRGR